VGGVIVMATIHSTFGPRSLMETKGNPGATYL